MRKKELSLAAFLLALIFTFAGSLVAPARAQAGATADDAAAEYVPVADESFVLYQNEAGETVCRPATAAERARIGNADGTHVIYRGAPQRRRVIDGEEVLMQNSVEDSTGLPLLPSAGLTIVLQGTAQLDANPVAKNAFIVAANRWESIISTPATITLSVDYGPTFFGEAYDSTTILGQTASFIISPSFSSVRTRLVNSAATQAELALYNALPASSVPAEFNGNTVQISSMRVNTAQGRALGFSIGGSGTDAQIGFNSNFGIGGTGGQFDFDPSDGITAGFTDFDAVVTHEIGHALGFSSSNGSSTGTSLTIWDLFRFRPSTANASNFGSALRVLTKGGTQVMFGDFTNTFATQELGLSTGGPNPPEGDTDDGRQSSHWKADELSATRPYIGVMDPTLSRGLRRTITENDIRALELIGYSVVFNPTRPVNDNFLSAAILSGAAGGFTGTSQWATRESGEPSLQAGFQSDKSVWFFWTAPTTGTATFDTVGSGFDTTLGIYTGSLGTLASLDQNDDVTGLAGGASRITFNTVAGTVYRIDVDGWNGEYGNVQLNWTSSGTQPTPTPTPTPQFFNVTGRVTDAAGNGIGGVRIGLSSPSFNVTAHPLFTTDSNGNYSITALSTGTVYTISPIRDGVFNFSPAPATFSGAGANMVFNFTTSPGNPIDGSTRFVEQHYQDFLGRTADASGLAFWTGEIESCAGNLACREVKRINVSAAFFQSIEFQNTGYLVERMYKAAYGDRTEASTGLVVPIITRQEFVQDAPLISAGVVVNVGNWQAQLEANKVAYAQTFVQRARFTAAYPASLTPAEFVVRLNQNTGGALTQAEVDALVAELSGNNTVLGRASVLRKVAENAEVDRREKNRAFVLMEYFGYLRRNPSDAPEANLNYAGWNFWLGKLNEFNGNFVAAEMVKAFLDASEYRGRFGP